MALEPLAAIALLCCVAGLTLHLTDRLPSGRLLAAIVLPLELAGTCALLNLCLERRALTQEYALAELVLWLRGDLARAFPSRPRRTRERVEAETPVLAQLARDLLEGARETPCWMSRVTSAWVALVLTGAPCGRWAWHALLHEGPGALLAGFAIAPGIALFAHACNDLRRGRVRSLGHGRLTRTWARGYKPVREPTILPTVPVIVLWFLPAIVLGAMWSNGASLENHLSVTQAVLTLWLLLWNGRRAANNKAFLRVEHALAPLDRLIRENITRAWDLLSLAARACGWSAALLLAVALSWPAPLDRDVPGLLIDTSSGLLIASLLLGLLVLRPWRRPVSPITYSARQLIGLQGETQERRISAGLHVAFGCSLLAFIVIVGVP